MELHATTDIGAISIFSVINEEKVASNITVNGEQNATVEVSEGVPHLVCFLPSISEQNLVCFQTKS